MGLQCDDPDAIEGALRYLEADPWEFRSGYLKGRLLHHLVHRELDERQRRRLRPVLLRYCDVGARLEFAKACRLARRVHVPGLRDELVKHLYGGVVDADVRCLRMLFAMKHPRLSERDTRHARSALLQWAGERSAERDAQWLAPTVRRLWPDGAVAELTALAHDPADEADSTRRRGAQHLLRSIRHP
jgi:hypothetical protein